MFANGLGDPLMSLIGTSRTTPNFRVVSVDSANADIRARLSVVVEAVSRAQRSMQRQRNDALLTRDRYAL